MITYSIEFAAAIARLEEGTKQGARHVKKMADEMESAASFARTALATLGVALSAGAFAAAVKGASEAADAAAKMGDRFGIATEKMIGMQFAGHLAGVTNEALAMALQKMAKSGVEAARGGEEAAKAYGLLHINAREFVKLPMDQQFSIMIDKLGQVENVALRNALAAQVLGKSYGQVMGLVAEGSGAFEKAIEDAEAWGLAINRVDAAKLEMANDAIKRMQASTKGLFTLIALQLAPVVRALADHFADTKAAAKGYREEVAYGAEIVVQAIAYSANVVQGLKFAYVGVKLVIAEVLNAAAQGFAWVAQNAGWLGKVLSALPGPMGVMGRLMVNFIGQGQEAFTNFALSTSENARQIREELQAIALEGLPAEKIIEKVKQIRVAMEKEAVVIAQRRQDMMKGSGADIVEDKKPKDPKNTFQIELERRIEQIRQGNMAEQEALIEGYLARKDALDRARGQELIDEDFYNQQSLQNEIQHQAKMGNARAQGILQRQNLEKMSASQQLEFYTGTLVAITAEASQHDRKMFALNKAARISNAIMSTMSGAAKALEWGWPMGPIFAAIMIAAGMINVRAIAAQQFGGGGSAAVPSAGGGVSAPAMPDLASPSQAVEAPAAALAQQAAMQPRREITITFVGSGRYTQEEIRDSLLPALNEALGDGLTLKVS